LKIPENIQKVYPLQFKDYLIDYLKLTLNLILSQKEIEKDFKVECMNFIGNVITTKQYERVKNIEKKKDYKERNEINEILFKNFFSNELIGELIIILIEKFMLLTDDDFYLWENDPEKFFDQEYLDDSDLTIKVKKKNIF
jgi:hypothetical protein